MRIKFVDVPNLMIRMGPDLVEGYLIHPDKPWCLPFAVSETEFTKKVGQFGSIYTLDYRL